MRFLLFAAFALAGCSGGSDYTYKGYVTSDFFPLDGTRTWQYAQEDDTVTTQIRVEKVPQTVQSGSEEIVTLEYRDYDPAAEAANPDTYEGDLLYSIDWSSDSGNGILIHGYSDETTGASATYDPPITFGSRSMVAGDTISTDTDTGTFTSTLVGTEACPNFWRDDWDCLAFTMDDGDGDDTTGPPFAGSWWIATSWGASRFITTGNTSAWALSTAAWTADQ